VRSDRDESHAADPHRGPRAFTAPWQAQAFALAVKLSEQGHFTWPEWTQELSRQIREGAGDPMQDAGDRYYRHWLDALETLILQKGLLGREALAERKAAWLEAYRCTPHGQPVKLHRGSTRGDPAAAPRSGTASHQEDPG